MFKYNWNNEKFDLLLHICGPEVFADVLLTPLDSMNRFCIHFAASVGNIQFIEKYFSFIPKLKDKEGNTCAHYACAFEQVEIYKFILEKYPESYMWRNNKGQIPIHFAFAKGSIKILIKYQNEIYEKKLLKIKDNEGNNGLLLSSSSNYSFIYSIFRDKDHEEVNKNGETILHKIIKHENSYEMCKEILKENPKLIHISDNHGILPFFLLPSTQNSIDYLQLFLNYDFDVNYQDSKGNTILYYCIYFNNYKYFKFLWKNDKMNHLSVNNKGRNILHIASYFGNEKIIKLIINTKLDHFKSKNDSFGRSPIYYAAVKGNIQCILLLNQYFNLHSKDNYGTSPLEMIKKHKNSNKILESLSHNNININEDSSNNNDLQNDEKQQGDEHLEAIRLANSEAQRLQRKEEEKMEKQSNPNKKNAGKEEINNKSLFCTNNNKDEDKNIKSSSKSKKNNNKSNQLSEKEKQLKELEIKLKEKENYLKKWELELLLKEENLTFIENYNDKKLLDQIKKHSNSNLQTKISISDRITKYFHENKKVNEKSLKDMEEDIIHGKIPIGYHDNLLWTETSNIFLKSNEILDEINDILKILQNDYNQMKNKLYRLKFIENKCNEHCSYLSNEIEEFSNKKLSFDTLKSISCENEDFISKMIVLEETLALKVLNQIETPECFSISNDKSHPSLTLIFNSFGLSSDVIEAFNDFDGSEFLSWNIFDLCDSLHIQNNSDRFDLQFLQIMLQHHKLPDKSHIDHCVVCRCSDTSDLISLLKEHELSLNYDILKKLNLNGPRFLGLSSALIPNGEKREFMKAVGALKKIHWQTKKTNQ